MQIDTSTNRQRIMTCPVCSTSDFHARQMNGKNLSVKLIPFRHIQRFLRVKWRADVPMDRAYDITLVNLSLSRAANLFPWRSLCLSRSIAAFIMFRRREIPALIFVGVKFVEDTSRHAHAWGQAGREITDGKAEDSTFTPLLTSGTEHTNL